MIADSESQSPSLNPKPLTRERRMPSENREARERLRNLSEIATKATQVVIGKPKPLHHFTAIP